MRLHCAALSVWGEAVGVALVPWASALSTSPDHSPLPTHPSCSLVGLEGREQSEKLLGLTELWGKKQGQSCGNMNNAGPEQNCGAGPWSWGPGTMLKVRDRLGRAGEEERQESRQHCCGSPAPPRHTVGSSHSWNRDLHCDPLWHCCAIKRVSALQHISEGRKAGQIYGPQREEHHLARTYAFKGQTQKTLKGGLGNDQKRLHMCVSITGLLKFAVSLPTDSKGLLVVVHIPCATILCRQTWGRQHAVPREMAPKLPPSWMTVILLTKLARIQRKTTGAT